MKAFFVVFFGLLLFAILGGAEARSLIHSLHEGLWKMILVCLIVGAVVFVGSLLGAMGARAVFDLVALLAVVALVVLVVFPVGRLIVFSHPLGPTVGLAFIGVILARLFMRGSD